MIAIEGPDLAGKTTLAGVMASSLGVPYVHMSAPGPDGDWAQVLRALAEREYDNAIVFDRLVLSDYAYRSVWPHPKPNTPEQLRKFLAYMRYSNSLIIQADVPDLIIEARYASRGDEAEQLNAQKIVQVARKYRRMFDALRDMNAVRIIRYDSSEDTPQAFVARYFDALLEATFPGHNQPIPAINLDPSLFAEVGKVLE
jgi:thymidylate kinase